ncbi:MAG TPA: ribosome biogenesis GTPase Der [Burkholderiales bacterium]|nr:ribosome biogenesis GTPase Der [Burkholderiales bacterium]
MKPTIALVGRPNVGKSTLFNRLTRTRDALVADVPGLTRDRHYGHGLVGPQPYLVVDTGGLEPSAKQGIYREMARQTLQAVDEADVVLFLVDARAGLTAQDREIAVELRRTGKRLLLVANKCDGLALEAATAEFHELGLGAPHAISAAHGEGVRELMDKALQGLPPAAPEPPGAKRPRIAVVGRPNVGKSTLVNALVGEERVITFDQPGTTRDSIYIDFERNRRPYTLIDTAGLRRRARVEETAEKFSVIQTMHAIDDANVVVLVLDARQQIADQDAHIAGFILDAGRALVVAINKWDGLSESDRDPVRREFARRLPFIGFARVHRISALERRGLSELIKSIDFAYAAAMAKLPTPKLTRALIAATTRQPPPRHGLFRPKLRYAHQGGSNPPVIVIHGNQLDSLPESYRRYLERYFADAFDLQGTPLRVQFRVNPNPYADKK